jgi:hypothetical protein
MLGRFALHGIKEHGLQFFSQRATFADANVAAV